MSVIATLTIYGLSFLAVIAIITLVHELGHFTVARRCGVRIEAFAIGFGRELVGWTDRRGTRFKLCLLPLGGYVKMFGERGVIRDADGMRSLTREEAALSYFHRPVSQRAAIVLAGPIVNILFGTLVIALLLFFGGAMAPSTKLAEVRSHGPAATAGLVAGDRITAVGGRSVAHFDEIVQFAAARIGQQVDIALLRDGVLLHTALRPLALPLGSEMPADIGATPAGRERIYPGPVAALDQSMVLTVDFLKANVRGIAEIASGARSIDDLAGPVRIAEFSGDTMLRFGLLGLIWLTALLSINVGVVNLLPIPVLDGGHLLFMALETVRRRPLSPRILKICSLGGLSVILVVFLLITGHDLARLDLFG